MWHFVFLVSLATTTCLPPDEKDEHTIPTTDNFEQLQKTVSVVTYIQNFKKVMADYVTSQYQNLTEHDVEKIKYTLEEFLVTFANDLRETVDAQQNMTLDSLEQERENIKDGVPDETFVEIKERMKAEFPEIKDETADVIIVKLRRNLHVTRQKIDTIIKSSDSEFQYAVA